jgi:hypothetical protein
MTTRPPLALVTGASAGIGEALARRIAGDGYDLVLVARRKDRLEALAADLPVTAHPVALDLGERDAGKTLADEIAALGRGVDVLVNNAGFGHTGAFAQSDAARQTGMVDLNVRALVDLSHRVLPGMIERGTGGILNVASTAAFQPGPMMAVYYASKSFVLSFSEALSEEVRGSGVTICALCPGPTRSEFGAVSGLDRVPLFARASKASAADVADAGWTGFRDGRRVVIPGVQNKLSAVGAPLLPRPLLLRLVRRLQSAG